MSDLFPHDERIEIIRGDGYRNAFLKRMCKSSAQSICACILHMHS